MLALTDNMGIVEILGLLLGGGGLGSIITYLVKMNSEKKIADTKASEAEEDLIDKKDTHDRDKFSAMYVLLNKILDDYNALSDDYRKYREDALEKERRFINKVSQNCEQLADLKALIVYLKKLRCYNTDCKYRVHYNPDSKNKE